jgi:hypothetical protein
MTLPKKNTRRITVDGVDYFWHRNWRWVGKHSHWIVVQRSDSKGQLLFVDPYHHDLSWGPAAVAEAIGFALANGWQPLSRQPAFRVAYNGREFFVTTRVTPGSSHSADQTLSY